jgi:hypothetical protein
MMEMQTEKSEEFQVSGSGESSKRVSRLEGKKNIRFEYGDFELLTTYRCRPGKQIYLPIWT